VWLKVGVGASKGRLNRATPTRNSASITPPTAIILTRIGKLVAAITDEAEFAKITAIKV
jgi:hypothetical protein